MPGCWICTPIRPLDTIALNGRRRKRRRNRHREEHLLQGGMGSNVARVIAGSWPVPMRFVALPIPTSSRRTHGLLEKYHLTAVISSRLRAMPSPPSDSPQGEEECPYARSWRSALRRESDPRGVSGAGWIGSGLSPRWPG